MNEETKIFPLIHQNKTFTQEFRGVRYDYYLTGNIGPAEDYLDLCNILRSASPQDEVVIRINSGGGSVHTGNMIINAINESEANVIGFIESDCGSMATFIFLACHTWGVSEAAEFFAHTCSYGTWGKEHENFTQVEFLRKQQHKVMRKRYSNFLTSEEIDKIILGQDVYLDADEVMERLEIYSAARQEKGCGNEECEDCNQEPINLEEQEFSLEDMMENAVALGVEKALTKVLKKYDLMEKEKKPSAKTKKALEQAKTIREKISEIDSLI